MKRSFYREVPSPAPFFQALYSVHCGDFQVRVGPQQEWGRGWGHPRAWPAQDVGFGESGG